MIGVPIFRKRLQFFRSGILHPCPGIQVSCSGLQFSCRKPHVQATCFRFEIERAAWLALNKKEVVEPTKQVAVVTRNGADIVKTESLTWIKIMDYASFDTTQHPDLPPIFVSCKNGDLRCVESYLSGGISPYIDHPSHPSLAVITLGEGNLNMMELLISYGFDVNRQINRFGETALLRAIGKNDLKMVEFLLANGADPNLADQINFSPLMAASASGNIDMIRSLISRGADPSRISDRGRNGLLEAVANDQSAAIRWWLSNGADAGQRDANGSSALIIAAKAGKVGSVHTLLELGADINAKDKRGKTAMDWAKANGHNKIVELLQTRLGAG